MRKTILLLVSSGCLATLAPTASAQTTRPPASGFVPSRTTAGPSGGTAGTIATPKPSTTVSGSTYTPTPKPFSRPTTQVPTVDGAINDDGTSVPAASAGSRFGQAGAAASGGYRSAISDEATETEEPVQPTHTMPAGSRSFTPAATGASTPRTFSSGATASTPRNSLPNSNVRSSSTTPRVASATPVSTTPSHAASPTAEALLKQMLEPRTADALPGKPLALAQVVDRSSGTAQRIRGVQAYWKLTAKVVAYHAALDDRMLFSRLNTADRTALAAQLAADAAVHRAELEVVDAQSELADAAGLSDAQALPSDLPLVSEYRTEFTTLYSSGAAPSGLRRIDRAMPYHLKDVRSRADAVVAAHQAVQTAAEGVSTRQATMAELLEVHRHYSAQRAAFSTAVLDYNAMIAEYALHVAPNHSTTTIVSMLIKTKPATARTVTPTSIRPASAESAIADHAPAIIHDQPHYAAQEPAPRVARNPARYTIPADETIGDETATEEETTAPAAGNYVPSFRR